MAASLGKKWLLLLDQDTHFPVDTIENYHAALTAFPGENCFVPQLKDRMGVISPFKFRLGNGFRVSSVMAGIQNFQKLHVVNSGLMISANAFRQANGYDEHFPLDFSDYAFIERIRSPHPTFVLLPLSANHQHSSSQQISMHEELKRFKHFVSAANLFKKKYHPGNLLIILRPFLRALKLSARHKTIVFVKQYFDSMWHG
jgi:GT2 family glycosyltransferase